MQMEQRETAICSCQTYMQEYEALESQYLNVSQLPNILSSCEDETSLECIHLDAGSYEILWELASKDHASTSTLFLHYAQKQIVLPSIHNYGIKHAFMDMGGTYSLTLEKPTTISFSLQTTKTLYQCSFYLTIIKKEHTI